MARSGWAIGVCRDVEFVHGHGTSAKATWDEGERVRREVAGHLEAARRIRGRRWAWVFAWLAGAVLLAESSDPRRPMDIRAGQRLRGRLYCQAARKRACLP
jgi:hypothetical protein